MVKSVYLEKMLDKGLGMGLGLGGGTVPGVEEMLALGLGSGLRRVVGLGNDVSVLCYA